MPYTAAISKHDHTRPAAATIDGVAGDVALLRQRLLSGEKISSRELRTLWSERLRAFWRLHIDLYRSIARRFLEHGDNYLASEAADEAGQFFGDDVALILIRALATARSGAPQAAQSLLTRKQSVLADAVEAKSLLARTFKDLWKSSGEDRYLQESFDLYHLDYTTTKGDRAFPGVNAASMALFLGRTEEARRIAGDVLGLLQARPDTTGYWDQVTIAECLLVAGQIEPARLAYAAASSGGHVPYAHLATTRGQARLLLRQLGRHDSEFDSCFPLPGVIAFTGHRIDEPSRVAPRFPENLVPAVKDRIRQAVAQAHAGFGYSSAANGSDILFLECLQEAGLETYVHLPLPEEDFLRESVLPAGPSDWPARFRAVIARATEYTCATHVTPGALSFDYGNRLMLGGARRHARQLGSALRLLAVWDGQLGDPGAGGTGDCIQVARDADVPIEVLDITAAQPHAAEAITITRGKLDQLLSVLTFTLASEEAEPLLATSLRDHEPMHREVSDLRIRLFFQHPNAAARAARAILRDLAKHLASALGLHTGPVRVAPHSLTGETIIRGEHIAQSEDLAALDPAGLIYASSACVALLGLQPQPDTPSEFLGYRALRESGVRKPIFQILP